MMGISRKCVKLLRQEVVFGLDQVESSLFTLLEVYLILISTIIYRIKKKNRYASRLSKCQFRLFSVQEFLYERFMFVKAEILIKNLADLEHFFVSKKVCITSIGQLSEREVEEARFMKAFYAKTIQTIIQPPPKINISYEIYFNNGCNVKMLVFSIIFSNFWLAPPLLVGFLLFLEVSYTYQVKISSLLFNDIHMDADSEVHFWLDFGTTYFTNFES